MPEANVTTPTKVSLSDVKDGTAVQEGSGCAAGFVRRSAADAALSAAEEAEGSGAERRDGGEGAWSEGREEMEKEERVGHSEDDVW